MFRGIDPDGLVGLAQALDRNGADVRHQIFRSLAIIRRNHPPFPSQHIEAANTALDLWASDTVRTLRWRANAIRSGQEEGLNLIATFRAEFAATTPFSLDTFDESLQQWIADAKERRQTADDAISDITRWLDQGLTDWDVSSSDLHNIEASLRRLSPAELNLVIDGLAPRQLHRWVQEFGNSFNGFSQAEKQQLFTFLAENTDGDALGKVHDAILSAAGAQEAIDFGTAIQLVSADPVITDFVEYAVRHDLSGHEFSTIAPALAMGGVEDRQQLNLSLRVLLESEDALLALMADSATIADHDKTVDPMGAFVTHLAATEDERLKAESFLVIHGLTATGAPQLADLLLARGPADIRNPTDDKKGQHAAEHALAEQARADLLRWCTDMLVSDADGIVTLLASELDPLGDATADYFYQLVSAGEAQQLNQVVEALRGGPTVSLSKFDELGSDPEYLFPHAQNLGYVAGALNRGVQMCADDAEDDIDAIEAAVGVVMFALELPLEAGIKATDWATGLVGRELELNRSDMANATQDDIDRYTYNVVRAIEGGLKPSSPVDDETEVKLRAIQLWDDQYIAARDRYHYPEA